jgi:hypothetical protein
MKSVDELKQLICNKLVAKLDMSKLSDLASDTLRREIGLLVERICDTENPLLSRKDRECLIETVLDRVLGQREGP